MKTSRGKAQTLSEFGAKAERERTLKTQHQPSINTERVTQSVRMRFNPLRGLVPDRLAGYLDQFDLGFFRQAAIVWDRLERRDYKIKAVAPKRKKAVARHGFDVITVDQIPAGMEKLAEDQAAALTFFYNNLTATDALKPDQRGGMSLLSRQMMDAQAKYYAVHEIVWQPRPEGLTAQFVFCPLWWFEGTTGKLRYMDSEFQVYGRDMEEGEWLVTCGEGIMEACSVAWMFKHLSLQDWLNFCERYGQPFIDAATTASPGSDQWEKLVEYVENVRGDGGGVRSQDTQITMLEAKTTGIETYAKMVENMDRAVTILWRGGDLSTTSAPNQNGASLQGDESDILESDDTAIIEETLSTQVSRFVIEYTFGVGTPVLAYVKFRKQEKQNVDLDLRIDEFLRASGAPLGVKATLERYNRPMPDEGEELLTQPAAPDPAMSGRPSYTRPTNKGDEFANEALEEHAHEAYAAALAADLQSMRERLAALLEISDDNILRERAIELADQVEQLKRDITRLPRSAQVLAETQFAALFTGLTEKTGRQFANFAADQARDSLGQWVDENGGGLSEADNIARGNNAIERAIRQRRDVQKAMYRKEVGRIDFSWGNPGDKSKDFAEGHGISHIIAKHGEADARRLPLVLAKGKIKPNPRDPENKRLVTHEDYEAALVRKNTRQAWVLTGFTNRRQVAK